MPDVERTFITTDMTPSGTTGEPVEITFNMIEDEDGETYWGYGHQDADEFTAEINRWSVHCGAITDPDDLIQVGTPVEHRYAKMTNEERFMLVEPGITPDIFPVTRLML